MSKTPIVAAVVMALVMTACGGDDEADTTEAVAASTTAVAAESTTTTAAVAETTTTTAAVAESTTTTAAAAPVAASDGTIDVTLASYDFSPVASAVISGESIVVNVENRSSDAHTWTLLTAGTVWTTWQDFDLEQILVTTQGVPGDGTVTLQFTAPEPGTYQIVCTVRGHIQRGMVGELVVEG